MKHLARLFSLAALRRHALLLALLLTAPLFALTSGKFTYSVFYGKATITDFPTSYSGALTIPSTLGGYPVTSIGDYAFRGCSSLTSVVIPASVTSISEGAFLDCRSLTSVVIPASVKSIGYRAFQGCSSLTSVVIPASVTSIGDGAFEGVAPATLVAVAVPNGMSKTNLTSVTIPEGVSKISKWAFKGCSNLKTVSFPTSITSVADEAFAGCSSLLQVLNVPDRRISFGVGVFTGCASLPKDESGVSFTTAEKTRLLFAPTSLSGAYQVPDTVKYIHNEAFKGCTKLTAVTVPNRVTRLEDSTFFGCSALKTVNLPETLTVIGPSAFANCSALAGIQLPSVLQHIEDCAFINCTGLQAITLPSKLSVVKNDAFKNCSGLRRVQLPEQIPFARASCYLWGNVFSGCTSLPVDENGVRYESTARRILISVPENFTGAFDVPETVEFVNGSAFQGRTGLTAVNIPASVRQIGTAAFKGCTGLTSVTLPDSVTLIASSGFADCTGLTSIRLSENITVLGSNVFAGCSSLPAIKLPEQLISLGGDAGGAFSGCSSLQRVEHLGRITTLYPNTFKDCTALTAIDIPSGVKSIQANAFLGCSALKQVTFMGTKPTATSTSFSGVASGCIGLYSTCMASSWSGTSSFYGLTMAKTSAVPVSPVIDFPALAAIGTHGHAHVAGAVTLEYALASGMSECSIRIDGERFLSSKENGRATWQPRSLGDHMVTWTSGTESKTLTVKVASLAFEADPEPTPPMEVDNAIAITPSTRELPQGGGGAAIVTSGSATWTAAASDDWITLNATSGDAGKPVAYVVGANRAVEPRIGYVYVSGHTHTIKQAGLGATLGNSEATVERLGGEISVAVVAQNLMPWKARTECDWLTVSPTSGSGEGFVTVTAAPWHEVSTRSGTVTIAGNAFTVFQYGSRMKLGSYASQHDWHAAVIPIQVDALATTEWSVTPNKSWISVVDAGNGKGGDTVTIALGENPSYLARTGTVTIGTETYTVSQAGRTDLVFSLSPTETTASVNGANGLIAVSATPDLPWSASSDAYWVTLYEATRKGAGNANIVYSVSPQSTLYERTATITVTPEAASGMIAKTQRITQSAATSSLSLQGYEFEAAGEAVSLEVTVSNIVEWQVVNNLDWLTLSGSSSRVGPGTVTLSAVENNSVYPRSGTVKIAERTFKVSQKARSVQLEYDTKLFGTDGGMSSISIHPDGNVAWTAVSSDVSWITIFQNESGTGDAEILYIVSPYVGDGSARTGTITIGSEVVYITQRAYDLSIDPGAQTVKGNNGAGEIAVSASIDDVWQAIATAPWVTFVEGYDQGTGNGVVRFLYTENDTGKTRVAKIIISGEVYTLTQAARTKVVISATVGRGGSVEGLGDYELGSEVSLTATPLDGYAFSHWTLPDGSESLANPLTFTAEVAATPTAHFTALAPTLLSVEGSVDGVLLTWLPIGWATRYQLYRGSTQVPSSAECFATCEPGTTSYLDTTGTPGLSYWYWVEAVGEADNTWSDPLAGTRSTPIVFSPITYTNLKGAEHGNPERYQEGTEVSFTDPSSIAGYSFQGWTPAKIEASATGPQAIYANWQAHSYTIAYSANGGAGEMAGTSATYDQAVSLAANTFTREGYTFSGWATSAAGAVAYAPGEAVTNLTAMANGVVTLYAVWAKEGTPDPAPEPSHEPPAWEVVKKSSTFTVYATIYDCTTKSAIEAEGSLLAAFSADGECRGVTEVMEGPGNAWLYQLVVGLESATESGIVLKVWNSATGVVTEVPSVRLTAESNQIIGKLTEPVTYTIGLATQELVLASGWNWISTYLELDAPTLNDAFAGYAFSDNDSIKTATSVATYYGDKWYPTTYALKPGTTYLIYRAAAESMTLTLQGNPMAGELTVSAGWNYLGLPQATATSVASLVHSGGFADGDIIKTATASASYYGGKWYYPSSFALTPGVGYMAKLANGGTLTVAESASQALLAAAPCRLAADAASLTPPAWKPIAKDITFQLYARVQDETTGSFLEAAGSRLAVFSAAGECRGIAEVSDGPGGLLYQLVVGLNEATEDGLLLTLWDAATRETLFLTDPISGSVNLSLGTIAEPVTLTCRTAAPPAKPSVEDDPAAEVEENETTGEITLRPSADRPEVIIKIPEGLDPAKVIVEVSTATEHITPNGATVKVVKVIGDERYDITPFLAFPALGEDGRLDLAAATIKQEIAEAILDMTGEEGASFDPSADQPLTTAKTKPGLIYILLEGESPDSLEPGGESKVGDGQPWTPTPTKHGSSAFYRIRITK